MTIKAALEKKSVHMGFFMGFFILPALSYEDSKKENLCLQKRRELINANVPPSSLKIRNFQLFKDDVLVNIDAKKATE